MLPIIDRYYIGTAQIVRPTMCFIALYRISVGSEKTLITKIMFEKIDLKLHILFTFIATSSILSSIVRSPGSFWVRNTN